MKISGYKTVIFLLVSMAIKAQSSTNGGVCVDIKKSEFEHIVNQNNDLPALLMSLKILGDYAKIKLETPPANNLCTFASSRHRLFCECNKGISRIDMPQIDGQPTPGGKAEQMIKRGTLIPKKNGEVDLKDQFIAAMNNKFGGSRQETVDASTLKATQNEINGCYVAGMWWTLKQNPQHKILRAPLFIAQDNYILDGHHRWAAIDALEYGARQAKPVMMRVIRINTDIDTLLKEALEFTKEYGIEAQSV
ncbi:MAG: hypothetical protein P4L31_03055 [Candidatus Babeliales bacterium]|nr:hypothetical protein [Candidatus Babeliales bacterium]